VHIIVLRYCPSFTDNKNSVIGQHETFEQDINRRKYKLNGLREGYCIPFASEIKLMDYRVKKEVAAEFLRDLSCWNLHSAKNPTTLWNLITGKNQSGVFGIGRKTLLISYLFSLAYRCGIWLSPLDPAQGTPQKFGEDGWCYNFFIGCLPDVETEYGEEL
jgi:hypothetical protein